MREGAPGLTYMTGRPMHHLPYEISADGNTALGGILAPVTVPSGAEKGPMAARCGGQNWRPFRALLEVAPIVVIFIIALIVDALVDPYQRPISDYADGPTISYPKVPETASGAVNVIICFGLPLLFIVAVSLIRRNALIFYTNTLGLFENWTICHVVTTFGKKMAGSLRPNFLALCGWDITTGKCTGDPDDAQSARQSFPSGHSSTSMAGMLFWALLMNQHIAILIPKLPKTYTRMVTLGPILFAFWVAITRTWDHYHRFEDIVAGMIIGICSALYTFVSNCGKECDRCERALPFAVYLAS